MSSIKYEILAFNRLHISNLIFIKFENKCYELKTRSHCKANTEHHTHLILHTPYTAHYILHTVHHTLHVAHTAHHTPHTHTAHNTPLVIKRLKVTVSSLKQIID